MWLADRHSDQELYTAAKHCAKIHLAQLHQTEEFLNLPLCLLLDILKGINHCCPITACIQNSVFTFTASHILYYLSILLAKYLILNYTPLL